MKAIVDAETCIGCTLCVQICPEAYKMEDSKAIVTVDPIPENLKELCRQAAAECPVDAIRVEE